MILDNPSIDACRWLSGGGPHAEIVISSRYRLARNLAEYPFTHRATDTQLSEIAERTTHAIATAHSLTGAEIVRLDHLTDVDREYLLERHLASRKLVEDGRARLVAVSAGETLCVMVNEEDHLRLQCLASGLNLRQSWEAMDALDDDLAAHLDFAFARQWGYLTACPTNVGTGLRCSVMMHLPGLVMSKQIEKVLSAVAQMGLEVRGYQGEGTDIIGDMFQISNRVTLGASERDLVERIEKVAGRIYESERSAEQRLTQDARTAVEDRVFRALGTLTHARVLSYREGVELLSALRFGVNVGLLPSIGIDTVNELLICARPAHLMKRAGRDLEPRERDLLRADYMRTRLTA